MVAAAVVMNRAVRSNETTPAALLFRGWRLRSEPLPLTHPTAPDRSHIAAGDLKHWAKHWCVRPEDVRSAVEAVGNSAAAVQKELTRCGLIQPMEKEPQRS